MFDNKSIYALNKKDPDAIVYRDADGYIRRLTRADFSSEDEFLKWKAWSDGDYHDTEKRDHIYSDNTLSLYGLSDAAASVPSPEDDMVDKHSEQERTQLALLVRQGLTSCLTPAQRRRLWLYCVDKLTEDEIARTEHVKQQSISECLQRAIRKMKKFLKRPL